jgi:hypothetical protein
MLNKGISNVEVTTSTFCGSVFDLSAVRDFGRRAFDMPYFQAARTEPENALYDPCTMTNPSRAWDWDVDFGYCFPLI